MTSSSSVSSEFRDVCLVITGPVVSSGRTGSSWGKDRSGWDSVVWDASADIVANATQASALSIPTVFVGYVGQPNPSSALASLGVEQVLYCDIHGVLDPSDGAMCDCTCSEMEDVTPHQRRNDQRQWRLMAIGVKRALELGAGRVVRVRSDQQVNVRSLVDDLNFAANNDVMLLPAQRSLIELDSSYAGFCVMDFFIGGNIRLVLETLDWIRLGGRLEGPHQDLVWKPLLHTPRWLEVFPGLTTLSHLGSTSVATLKASYFWTNFAMPSSRLTMGSISWRGKRLNPIEYKICREEWPTNISAHGHEERMEDTTDISLPLSFSWDRLSHAITGIPYSSPSETQNLISLVYEDFVYYAARPRLSGGLSFRVHARLFLRVCAVYLLRYGKFLDPKFIVQKVREVASN